MHDLYAKVSHRRSVLVTALMCLIAVSGFIGISRSRAWTQERAPRVQEEAQQVNVDAGQDDGIQTQDEASRQFVVNLTNNGSITAFNTALTENFNTLATTPENTDVTWTDNSTIPGWYSTRTAYRPGTGSSNTGAMYAFGSTSSSDRALGSVCSGSTGTIYYAARFINNTGSAIQALNVSYTGEQWRNGGNTTQHALTFEYQVAPAGTITDANTPSSGWTGVSALTFTGPIATATAAALDGNNSANRVTGISSMITLNVPNGQEVWLRWVDVDNSGSDHGLAVDDLSVTAVPPVILPVPTCPSSPITVATGASATAPLSCSDGDGVVTSVMIQSVTPSNPGTFSITGFTPAGSTGGTATGTFNVGNTTPAGNYTVTLRWSNNDATPQTADCTFMVSVFQFTAINAIQGTGNTSPVVGQSVTTEGIVTGLRFNNGFFLQTEDALIDGDSNTSEGIFVFTSSAPPVAAAVGNKVRVTGTVTEFIPSADPFQLSVTQLTSPTVVQLSTGNPLPTPIAISSINGAGPVDQLEKYESMRVTFASLKVCAPTAGSLTESSATSSTVGSNNTGVFAAVINDGTPRPFREPGIEDPEPAPPGFTIPPLPRWDGNQERIRVDSEGQTGALPPIEVCTGAIVSNLTGPLYYDFRAYTLLPDPGARTITNNNCAAIPVPTPGPTELTIGSANLQRFFNDVDDDESADPTGPIAEPVLTTTAYQGRLNKLSLMVRNVMRSPDIIGFQEVENIEVLTDIANKINADLDQPGLYSAFLEEGNDVGGIDVGFLVNKNKIEILNVTQEGLDEVLVNPDTTTDPLNDRPSLVLEARLKATNYKITVINNHLRSLNGINSTAAGPNGWPTGGERVRAKRKAQAEYTANLVQARIDANPSERIILIGDFNAFQFNDGFVDTIGTIKGTPTPATMVTASSPDLVNPDLTNLIDFEDPAERYSFVFGGHAQTLDHALVTPNLLTDFVRINHGRNNSDFPEGPTYRNDFNRSERLSDHDPLVVAFDASSVQNALLYVADTSNNRIQKFDGTAWSVVGAGGTGALIGQFRLPEAVAASPDGQALYVADTGNNRIQYSLDGGVTWMLFAGFGTSLNQVKGPQGLVLDTQGNLYVSDTLNNRILRFNGGVPGTGVPLTATNFVSSPRGLAIDKDFNLFVTDHNNSRILKLATANATPTVSTLASVGSGLNQVRNPEGVALDDAGNVFVADKGNNRILQFVGGVPGPALVMASIGSSFGQVRAPEGVTITGFNGGPLNGVALVVSDTANNRIVGTVDGVTWVKVGDPFGGVGTQVGLFRSPSKIK